MSENEIPFSKWTHSEQEAIVGFYKESLKENFKESRNASWELAKFLFAANAGAAAGMFLMVRSEKGDPFLLAAFFMFCFGVFAVGVAYFAGAWGFNLAANNLEKNIHKVIKDELGHSEMMSQVQRQSRGWISQIVPLFGTLSFLSLCIGGLVAIKPFLVKDNSSKLASAPMICNVVASTTNYPAMSSSTNLVPK